MSTLVWNQPSSGASGFSSAVEWLDRYAIPSQPNGLQSLSAFSALLPRTGISDLVERKKRYNRPGRIKDHNRDRCGKERYEDRELTIVPSSKRF